MSEFLNKSIGLFQIIHFDIGGICQRRVRRVGKGGGRRKEEETSQQKSGTRDKKEKKEKKNKQNKLTLRRIIKFKTNFG